MTAARAAIGDYCFKKSTQYILNKCKWFDINDLITFSSLNTIHKILYYKKPISLVSLFRSSEKERKAKTVTTNYLPLTTKMSNFYIYKYSKIYNSLDKTLTDKKTKGFKNELKLMIRAGTLNDTMD